MFLGVDFVGTGTSLSQTTATDTTINKFSITNCVVDEIYATRNVLLEFDWYIPDEWDFNTYLHGLFENTTYAGNVGYSESIVERIKIKKRFKGDFTWKTIYEKDIRSNEDFAIELWDYYEPSNREVEYAYVTVVAGADVDSVSSSVLSEFEHFFLVDRSVSYPLILDVENTPTYNRESQTIVSPGRKYPYVVNNGIARYYSGSMRATFIEKKDCNFDVKNGWSYRNQVDEWLANGEAKILKTVEGDMWMVNIVGSLPRTVNGHYQHVSHQIDWVECGDPTMIGDLYDHGFIDTDTDRE